MISRSGENLRKIECVQLTAAEMKESNGQLNILNRCISHVHDVHCTVCTNACMRVHNISMHDIIL